MNILITGASSGIGEELAKRYSSEDNRLYLIARSCEKLKSLQATLKYVEIFCEDLSDIERVKKLGERLKELKLDMIILNAGISLGHNKRDFTPFEDFHKLFNINFISNHSLLEVTLPSIKESRGKIVFISSLASIITMPSSIAYSSSKRAINSYAEGLRYFLKPDGVKVINILPGFIETPLTDKNRFKMPFLMSLEDGVDRIEIAINRDIEEYAFPKRFYFFIKGIKSLPPFIRDFIIYKIGISRV